MSRSARSVGRTLCGVSIVAENIKQGACLTVCEAEAVIRIEPAVVAVAPGAGPVRCDLGVVQGLGHGGLDTVHVF